MRRFASLRAKALLFTGALLLPVLIALCPARAEDLSLQQFLHTRWTTRDGAPPSILALTQTSDGVLWIGTPAGLYTFNGYEFRPFQAANNTVLPSLDVASLAEDGQGGLWVGLWFGGIAHITSGRAMTIYRGREGVHPGNVQQIAAGSDGRAWAIAGNELIRFDGRRWQSVGPTEGESTNNEHGVDAIDLQPDGVLWVMFGSRLYRIRAGGTTFEPTREHSFLVNALRRAPDGQLWLADQLSGIRRACPDGCRPEAGLHIAGVMNMVFDAEGDLWACSGQGVFRIQAAAFRSGTVSRPAALERVTAADGLTSDHATSILRDREGNVWVGTREGLDRFQRSAFAPFPATSSVEPTSIVTDSKGTVWFGTYGRGLHSVRSIREASPPADASLPSEAPNGHTSFLLAAGADDSLLLSRNATLLRYRAAGQQRLPELPLTRNFPIFAMAEDHSRGLFVAIARNGVWRFWDGQWSAIDSGIRSSETTPMSLGFDNQHRLWMGFSDGHIDVLNADGARETLLSAGAGMGTVLVLARVQGRMWIGSASGVAWSEGAVVHPVRTSAADSLQGVSGIVNAADGSYWFNGAAGVARISADDIRTAMAFPLSTVVPHLFNNNDGLEGVALQVGGRPSATRDATGRLWFSTTSGLFFVDPSHLPVNVVPPGIRVTGVEMDNLRQQPASRITVPAGVHTLRIAYEGVSLTCPERVTYRYKLDGEDREWQNAGTGREAVYTGLRPGSYAFHVMAANASDVWSSSDPLLALRVHPSFYQTVWFRLACALACCVLLWLAYLWRVRFVVSRVEEKLNERARERVRIARDLHDTLLQGIQGLVLRFHFAAEQVPADQPARTLLSQALSRADEVISEGRDRVKQLRGQPSSTEELLKALLDAAESERWDRPIEIRTLAEGETRPLRPLVHDELYAIGCEAVVNALRHASPSLIEIELISHANELRLRCRDNGIGMPAEDPKRSKEHWGILGMEERAERLGARFDLWSSPGAGTEIEVRVRGAAAYTVAARHSPRFSVAHLFVHTDE